MKTLVKRYSLDKSVRKCAGEKRSIERSFILKRTYVFFISGILFIVILSACGISKNDLSDKENDKRATEANQQEADDDNNGQSPDNQDNGEHKLRTEIGIFNGQADPHTIEIETAEGPTAFQLSDSARADIAQLKEADEVIYTYYESDEQLIIEIIEEYWYHREYHHGDDHDDDHMEKGRQYDNEEEHQG